VRKSQGKRPLGRPRRKWVNNIKSGLGEVEWCVMEEINLD
jgi:hypothetical protein